MKNISVIIAGLSFFFLSLAGMCNTPDGSPTGAQKQASTTHAINLASSPELNSLVQSWVSEYEKLNAGVKINVSDWQNEPASAGRINLITSDYPEASNDQLWKMTVGRDAIVAIFNAANPMLNEINTQGISANELAALFSDPAKRNWNSLIDKGQNAAVNYYSMDSEKIKENLAAFAGIAPGAISGTVVNTSSEIISAIQKDKYAIGFCRLTDIREAGTNALVQGIKLLPVDKNQNGRLDSFENIYANLEAFTRGVWIGKYPRALCGNIYAVSAARPTDQNTVTFLGWVTTEGQKYLNANGYSDLASAEIKSNQMALLGETNEAVTNAMGTAENKPVISTVWLVVILLLVLSAVLIAALLRYGKKQNWTASASDSQTSSVLNEDAIAAPKGLYFDRTHTWVFMEKDGNVKVGIDDFLQHVTGTLSRVIMKNSGDKVRKGEKILTVVREGKQLNIYAPISGTIIQHNTSLLTDSSLVNTSPYADGWVYLIEPTNWVREMRFLFMGEKYTEWIQDEFIRLKDFFATSAKTKTPAFAHVILQDGGELSDNILAELEPEVWEDFQAQFINTSR